jgi:hypothetical protein
LFLTIVWVQRATTTTTAKTTTTSKTTTTARATATAKTAGWRLFAEVDGFDAQEFGGLAEFFFSSFAGSG